MPNHTHGIIIINSAGTPDRASVQKPSLGQIINEAYLIHQPVDISSFL